MYHEFNFSDVLAGSVKAAWQVEDVLPPELSSTRPPLRAEFDEAGAVLERRLKAPTDPATGTSKRASDAALGARRPCHIRFTATPGGSFDRRPGVGKPAVSALH